MGGPDDRNSFTGRRTSSGRGGKANKASPEALALFKQLRLTKADRSTAWCWRAVRAEAKRRGWTWPALRTVQTRVKEELPPSVRDYHTKGERRAAALHAPRIQRDYSAIAANEVWVGDSATLDLLAIDRGRLFRPTLTKFVDMRSRLPVGWRITRRASNADTILAAFTDAAVRLVEGASAAAGMERELASDRALVGAAS